MKQLLSFVLILFVISIVNPLWAQSLKITELAVTTKVSKGKPIDSVHRISYRTVKVLYCFSRTLSDDGEETSLRHVWLKNGQIEKETELPVKGRRWRIYSTLPISAASVGNWRVEVKDASGAVIKSVEFRIQ